MDLVIWNFKRLRLLFFPLQPDQAEEFAAGAGVFAEGAEHGAGDGVGVGLFDAAHGHAEMKRFDHDGDPFWLERLHQAFRDLCREPLLDLETSREYFDHSRDLGKADDLPVGDISNMGLAVKWQQ